jgi:hypothetical protein
MMLHLPSLAELIIWAVPCLTLLAIASTLALRVWARCIRRTACRKAGAIWQEYVRTLIDENISLRAQVGVYQRRVARPSTQVPPPLQGA